MRFSQLFNTGTGTSWLRAGGGRLCTVQATVFTSTGTAQAGLWSVEGDASVRDGHLSLSVTAPGPGVHSI